MKDIRLVTDDTGRHTAVLISLAEWGGIWEDIYDILVSESRRREPVVPWDEPRGEIGCSVVPSGT